MTALGTCRIALTMIVRCKCLQRLRRSFDCTSGATTSIRLSAGDIQACSQRYHHSSTSWGTILSLLTHGGSSSKYRDDSVLTRYHVASNPPVKISTNVVLIHLSTDRTCRHRVVPILRKPRPVRALARSPFVPARLCCAISRAKFYLVVDTLFTA